MTPIFEQLQQILRKLPGLGYRSAERIALHLTVEKPELLPQLVSSLKSASEKIRRCCECGNISEDKQCYICANPKRSRDQICVVEQVPDLVSLERAGAYQGVYHVLHGKLSPIKGIGPEDLNLRALEARLRSQSVVELILALANDIEGEATCHFIQETMVSDTGLTVTRIGFGLPSGGNLVYADAVTLKSALEARRDYR